MRTAFAFLVVCALHGSAEVPTTAPAQKLIFGFERDGVEQLAQPLAASIKDSQDVLGRPYLRVEMKSGRITREWSLFEGNASQGKWALGLGLSRWPDRPTPGMFPTKKIAPFENRDAVMHYMGMYADGDWKRPFNTSGIHHLIMPTDWSDYDLLRMDVYCKDLGLEYRIGLEDEDILPPVVQVMQAPAGKWTTLELDLRAAARARGLDPQRITSMAVAVTQVAEGKLDVGKVNDERRDVRFALLDNIRLCRRDVPAELPVVRDQSGYELLPRFYPPTTRRAAPKAVDPDRPNRAPITLEEPLVVRSGARRNTVSRMGWVSAYDNDHLSIGFEDATFWGGKVLQTVDGGKHWTGLAGDPRATKMGVMDFIDGGGNSDVVDRFGDIVVTVFGMGCGGPSVYHPRVFTKQLTFEGTGKGWSIRELRSFVDCEPRHCTATQSAFRAEDGRLWLAYGVLNRLNRTCIHIRFSDDDGLHWRPLELGQVGRVPGSLWPQDARLPGVDFGTYVKTDPDPRIVPLGKGFACLWHNRRTKSGEHIDLHFARFDGERWLPTQTVPYQPEKTQWHIYPRLNAVSLGGRDIFVQTGYANGLLHYRDGVWTHELPEVPGSVSRLCVAGEKMVMLIAAIPQPGGVTRNGARIRAPVAFQAWQRGPDGRWDGPREIAKENEPLPFENDWGGFQIPRFSPPNFVPLAWAAGGEWIKVLRVRVNNPR